jgi:hypothetical protein
LGLACPFILLLPSSALTTVLKDAKGDSIRWRTFNINILVAKWK